MTYDLAFDAKGRARADGVAFVESRSSVSVVEPTRKLLWLAVLFIVFVAGCTWLGKLPKLVPVIYVVASLFAFAVYAWDKSAAQNGEWRTQESTLHLLALIGGWPGALFAQNVLDDGIGELRCVGLVVVAQGGGGMARLVVGGLVVGRKISFLTDFSG